MRHCMECKPHPRLADDDLAVLGRCQLVSWVWAGWLGHRCWVLTEQQQGQSMKME